MEIILNSSNAKYYPDFHDNRDMKTFNTKLIVPFIITLLLTGCMPDSLTKFKKDAPTKSTATTTTTADGGTVVAPPVVDSSGNAIAFIAPTYFNYHPTVGTINNLTLGSTLVTIPGKIDGSLGDDTLASKFFERCDLDPGINSQTATLPGGITIKPGSCDFMGTPTAIKSVGTGGTPAFCSDGTSATQTICEGTHLTWNGTSCSIPDLAYSTASACTTSYNKWYNIGDAVPYRVKLTYHDAAGIQRFYYTTLNLGVYQAISAYNYTQSDKLLLHVVSNATAMNAIVPVKTISSVAAGTTAAAAAYPNTNLISSSNSALGVANFIDASQNAIGIKKVVRMTLNSSTGFTAGNYITTAGNTKIGKIVKKDSVNPNIIYVENVSPGEVYFAVGDELDNQLHNPFVAPEVFTVGPPTVYIKILAIDESIIFNPANPNLDNDRGFYSTKLVMDSTIKPTNSYSVSSPTDIKPLQPIGLPINNGTVFTVSPKLPSGLALNATTGAITGKFLKPLEATTFTITAKNPVSTATASFDMAASFAPNDLSLSTNQIITVSSTIFFNEGETLYEQIQPPLTSSSKGRISKIFANGFQMAVTLTEGSFLQNASLDSGGAFYSEKAFVVPDNSCVDSNYSTQLDCEANGAVWSTGAIYYNLGLKLDTNASPFTLGSCSDPTLTTQDTCEAPKGSWDEFSEDCSDVTYTDQLSCEEPKGIWGSSYVTSSAGTGIGATGIVAGIYRDATNDILFVRSLTGTATGTASAKTFYQGDTVSPGIHVIELDHNFMKLTLASSTNFNVGSDITSANIGAPFDIQAGGYIYAKSGAIISVSEISRAPSSTSFKVGDKLYNDETRAGSIANATTGANTTISAVTHDITYVAERGKSLAINTSVSIPKVTYSITPVLPSGLTLNTVTGKISGTPTAIMAKKDFLLKATNFIGQTTFAFSLEVRDYFSLTDNSGTSSFLLHKVGDTQIDRKCRVNASDILSGAFVPDVRCVLEGEEQDVYYNALKLQVYAGSGVCQYIQYTPYSFYQFAPWKSGGLATNTLKYTAMNTVKVGDSNCLTGSQSAPVAKLCDGNYYDSDGATIALCDEGRLDYKEDTYTYDPAQPVGSRCSVASSVTKSVQCGGKKVNCKAGPIRDFLSASELSSGFTGKIYSTSTGTGAIPQWVTPSPSEKGYSTNIATANSTTANMCSLTAADFTTWSTYATNSLETDNPFSFKTSPFYEVQCLDAAGHIKATIKMVVREWDRSFTIADGLDQLHRLDHGAYSAADLMNSIGIDSPYGPYNNILDWDDEYDLDHTGVCSDTSYINEETCYAHSETWTPSSQAQFQAPGSCGVVGSGHKHAFPGVHL